MLKTPTLSIGTLKIQKSPESTLPLHHEKTGASAPVFRE
jgi:hypothetical protein